MPHIVSRGRCELELPDLDQKSHPMTAVVSGKNQPDHQRHEESLHNGRTLYHSWSFM